MIKEKVLPQLVKEITKPLLDMVIVIGLEYDKCYDFVLNLFLNFLVIYFLIDIIVKSSSEFIQIVVSCVLVAHLFLWLCWSLKDILVIKDGDKNE